MKKIFLSVILGTIVYLLIGYFVFDFLLGDYTNSNTTNIAGFKKSSEQTSFTFLLISCLSYSLLLSLIVANLPNIISPIRGFKIGAIVGTLVAIMTDSYWYSTSNFYNNIFPLIADV